MVVQVPACAQLARGSTQALSPELTPYEVSLMCLSRSIATVTDPALEGRPIEAATVRSALTVRTGWSTVVRMGAVGSGNHRTSPLVNVVAFTALVALAAASPSWRPWVFLVGVVALAGELIRWRRARRRHDPTWRPLRSSVSAD